MNKYRYICTYQRKLQIDNIYGYLNISVFVVPPFIVINVLREFPKSHHYTAAQYTACSVLHVSSHLFHFMFPLVHSFFRCDTHIHPYQSTPVRVWYETDLTAVQGLQFIMNQDPVWHYSKFSVQQNRRNPLFVTDFLHSGRV